VLGLVHIEDGDYDPEIPRIAETSA